MKRRYLGPLLVLAAAPVFAVPALAGTSGQATLPPGTVLALEGTPHLWVADDQGTAHWAGDTRALAGKFVNWSDRRAVNLQQLQNFRRGDPWLSAGLVKIGDPIYLAKWESNEERPTLYHIQSIADVELFGINSSNYGAMVLDPGAWEQRYRMSPYLLAQATLPSAVAPTATPTVVGPTPTPTAVPSPLKAKALEVNRIGDTTVENIIEVTGAPPGKRLMVSATLEEWNCSPSCDSTRSDRWGPIDAGPADQNGRLRWVDQHSFYKSYQYTFKDIHDNEVTISFDDDRKRFGLS